MKPAPGFFSVAFFLTWTRSPSSSYKSGPLRSSIALTSSSSKRNHFFSLWARQKRRVCQLLGSVESRRKDLRLVLHLSDVVAVMRTLSLVHEHALEVVPDLRTSALSVGREELAHVDFERVGDVVLRLAASERLHVEDEAEEGEVEDLCGARE